LHGYAPTRYREVVLTLPKSGALGQRLTDPLNKHLRCNSQRFNRSAIASAFESRSLSSNAKPNDLFSTGELYVFD